MSKKFQKLATDTLVKLGFVPSGDSFMPWVIETKAGTLRASIQDDWLACKFDDVAKAKGLALSSRLNPYSGKWNWMQGGSDLGQFSREVARIVA